MQEYEEAFNADSNNIIIKGIFYHLKKDKRAKKYIRGALENYSDLDAICVILAYMLKSYVKRKKDLEKLNTKILFCIERSLEGNFTIINEENKEKFLNIILEAAMWLKNNLELKQEEIDAIDAIVLKVLNSYGVYNLEHLRLYLTLMWNLREYIPKDEFEKIFSPLFKGIVWKNTELKTKNEDEIVKLLKEEFHIDENIGKELLTMIENDELPF